MKLLLLILIMSAGISLAAQEKNTIDRSVFPDLMQVTPQPGKAIRGWDYKTDKEIVPGQKDTVIVGSYPAKILKFQFRGNAAGIACYTGADAGMIEYSVDEADWDKIDLFDAGDTQLRWFTLEPKLKNGKHTLQIRVARNKNANSSGTDCVIRSFYYNAE